MGYTVHYQPEERKRYPNIKRSLPVKAKKILLLCLLVVSLLAVWRWAEPIGNFLLPGDPQTTKTAIGNMVDGMHDGESFADAVTAFCREIIANAEF